MTKTFGIKGDSFVRNGMEHRILSGALQYFRVVPEYWEDRLIKCRAFGLNTVETYVPWNLHEPQPGKFDFTGGLDIRRFIELAGCIGLDVIFRPGPYICAEWELGGFPAWLLADRSMRLRSLYPPYLEAVDRFFERLMQEVGDLQCHHKGPIIAVQIENEYGSYGNNKAYLTWVEAALKRHGIETLLFTSDGAEDFMLQGGSLPHIFKTVNFGSRPVEAFAQLRKYQPEGPLMCMEFWNGWFDHWGQPHNTREIGDAGSVLDGILSAGASVNFYMMHGGSNFGFLNGANYFDDYRATVTSYDYGAPLSEHGAPNGKFFECQAILARHGAQTGTVPVSPEPRGYGQIELHSAVSLFTILSRISAAIESAETQTMEDLGQNFGFIYYLTKISGPRSKSPLHIQEVRDRAHVYQDGRALGIVNRNGPNEQIHLSVEQSESVLEILVENLGRVNYGNHLHDRKGITEGVRLTYQFLSDWTIHPLDLSKLPALPWDEGIKGHGPIFYRGSLLVQEVCDTFLKVDGAHGAVWVNGRCLGRYWDIGPQRTLYLPGPLLKEGENEIVVLELDGATPTIQSIAEPLLS